MTWNEAIQQIYGPKEAGPTITERKEPSVPAGSSCAPVNGYAALKDALDAACGEAVHLEDKAEAEGNEREIRFADAMYARLSELREIVDRRIKAPHTAKADRSDEAKPSGSPD